MTARLRHDEPAPARYLSAIGVVVVAVVLCNSTPHLPQGLNLRHASVLTLSRVPSEVLSAPVQGQQEPVAMLRAPWRPAGSTGERQRAGQFLVPSALGFGPAEPRPDHAAISVILRPQHRVLRGSLAVRAPPIAL